MTFQKEKSVLLIEPICALNRIKKSNSAAFGQSIWVSVCATASLKLESQLFPELGYLFAAANWLMLWSAAMFDPRLLPGLSK